MLDGLDPAATCRDCDARGAVTSQGLCSRCQDDLRFVVRPAAHREAFQPRQLAAEAGTRPNLEQLGVVVISSLPHDNSLWICDLCNAQIPAADEFTLIAMLGSYALCTPCATTFPFWPGAWTQPAPRACRCGACQRPLLAALSRT